MAKVICVLQQKGGAGKTTIAVHLAHELAALSGLSVAVADADHPQQSATKWIRRGQSGPVSVHSVAEDVEGRHLRDELARIPADIIVIDLPPRVESVALRAALYADLILVPVAPAQLDYEAAGPAITLCREVVEMHPGKRYLLVPNKVRAATAAGRGLPAELAQHGPVARVPIGLRQALSDAASTGEAIGTYARNSAAHQEIQALGVEALELLGGQHHGEVGQTAVG